MTSLAIEIDILAIVNVRVSEDALTVDLNDGRVLSVPLTWFPRLVKGTADERNTWRLIGPGHGIHWPLLDEDISLAGLIAGRPALESPPSLQAHLNSHQSKN